eukprot:9052536-Prorocentrum_lima.AAC.1
MSLTFHLKQRGKQTNTQTSKQTTSVAILAQATASLVKEQPTLLSLHLSFACCLMPSATALLLEVHGEALRH